jgi:hypothetical protein
VAIEEVGTRVVITHVTEPAFTNAATGSVAITVPSDCTLVVIGLSAFLGSANALSAAGNFDINGNTSVGAPGGCTNAGAMMSALHYIVNPATGSQNLDWQWGGGTGTGLDSASTCAIVSFWKGVDTASPTRDSDGAVSPASATATTPTLTAQSGDLIIAWGASQDDSSGNLTFSWSGATELAGMANDSGFDGSLATVSPSGNQTVGFTATGAEQTAVAAFVFKAAAGSASASISPSLSASASATPSASVSSSPSRSISASASPSAAVAAFIERTVIDFLVE